MSPLKFLLVGAGILLAQQLPAQAVVPVSLPPGAWQIAGTPEQVMIVTPNYWTQAIHDREQKKFIRTFGGTHRTNGEACELIIEFDSQAPQRVGERSTVGVKVEGASLRVIHPDGRDEAWTRVDSAEGPLAGVWRISGRQVGDKFTEMPLRARRTLKILSGTRFQWVAINVETGEFSGTGGGTYTFANGKYTEHIGFFSRDGSRVGAELVFDGEVKDGNWRHRGLSSRGDPIDEVWSRFEPGAK